MEYLVKPMLSLLLIACCLPGCHSKDAASGLPLDVNGVPREYRLFVPTQPPDGPMPLVVAIHGGSGRDDRYPEQTALEELAEAQGFVVAYPLSELLPGNEGEWQLNTDSQSRQDLDFIEALIDELSVQYSIDQERVYASGYSLGSMFTYELACHLSARFAAVASHAGSMPMQPNSCAPEHPLGVMHIHATQDEIIPYADSWDWKEWPQVGPMMSIPGLVDYWTAYYNCLSSDQVDSGSSTQYVRSSCDEGARVEHYRLEEGGHEWPVEVAGVPTHEVMWSFWSGFRREG